jgi:heptosyltransferase-2
VSEVIEFPFAHGGIQLRARRQLAQQLDQQFERAYVCPNSLKSALLPFLAGIPVRIGYLGEARVGLLTHRLKNPAKGKRPPMVAFYSTLSAEPDVSQDRPHLQLDATSVDADLKALGLTRLGYHVFAPGAEYGDAKRWPAEHYAQCAMQLDLPVNAARAGHCLNLAGKTSLAQALSVIAATKSMVSNDSGLMHVAAGFGVRQVAVFGSSSPLHTPPLNTAASVIWLKNQPNYQPPLDCAPCFERTCPLGHTRCLNDITVDMVLRLL